MRGRWLSGGAHYGLRMYERRSSVGKAPALKADPVGPIDDDYKPQLDLQRIKSPVVVSQHRVRKTNALIIRRLSDSA